MKKPKKDQISEKNISLAGARTLKSDYFRAAQYLRMQACYIEFILGGRFPRLNFMGSSRTSIMEF